MNMLIQRELKFWIDAALDEHDQISTKRRFTAPELLRHLEGRGVAVRKRSDDAIVWRFCPGMRGREHEVQDICLWFVAESVASR